MSSKAKPLLLLPIILCLVFAMCKEPDDNNEEGTIANPKVMVLQIDLGKMTDPNSVWQNLLSYIEGQGKYVALDLSACIMNGTEFDPVSNIETGKGKIVSIILPDAAKSINGSFSFFSILTSVTLPEGLLSIGNSAFYRCTNLTRINLPESIVFIGDSAFSGCTSLALTSLPVGIMSIGDSAFSGCTSLALTSLPEGITSIGYGTFRRCINLTQITLPMVTSVGSFAFNDCTNLTQITFPAETSVDWSAFSHCQKLVFNLTGNGSLSVIENGRALVRNNTELLAYPSASGSITIPEGITSIGDLAFSDSNIIQINLPEGLTSIGSNAFVLCSNLIQVYIPNSVTFIDFTAFGSCTSLTEITLPENLKFMRTFAFTQCESLSLVTSLATTPPELEHNGTFNHTNLQQIKVPADSVAAYKAASYWSEYADIITAIE